MIPEIVGELGKLLGGSNQFASGGLLLMAVGAIGASLRRVPGRIWDFFRHQTTISVTIVDEMEAYRWFKWWVGQTKYGKTSRRVDAYTIWDGTKYVNRVSIAPGFHWFWYKKRPMFLNISRDEKKDQYNSKRSESVRIWTYGRNQRFFVTLLTEMMDTFHVEKSKSARLFYRDVLRTDWVEAGGYYPRPLNSVILPSSIKDRIVSDIKNFAESKQWYEDMGIPYHRGYLLHGPPGTGKTSLIMGLSNELKTSVYVINLAEMDDAALVAAVSDVSSNSMVVLEDVDCVAPTREQPKDGPLRKGVTLSGLLNVLDGISTPSGVKFFLTTNFVEKLDPALIRPGRVDLSINIPEAGQQEIEALYKRFFPSDTEMDMKLLMSTCKASTMAEYQQVFMQERNDRIARQAKIVEVWNTQKAD